MRDTHACKERLDCKQSVGQITHSLIAAAYIFRWTNGRTVERGGGRAHTQHTRLTPLAYLSLPSFSEGEVEKEKDENENSFLHLGQTCLLEQTFCSSRAFSSFWKPSQ